MVTKRLQVIILCFLAIILPICANNPMWNGKGRIVISSDGNEHDNDDWSATAFSLALIKAGGLDKQLPLYIYSDHIWGSNRTFPNECGKSAYEQIKESALEGKEMFGLNSTKFVCAVDNPEFAYSQLVNEINISTEKDPLIIIAAGPMQVVGEAINRANKQHLKYVTILSHSLWNENHSDNCYAKHKNKKNKWDLHQGWTLNEIENCFGRHGLAVIRIADQNGKDEFSGLFCKIKYFDWLKKESPAFYKKGTWEWLYSRLEVCIKGKNKDCFDISDAGMIVYLLTGKENNQMEDVRLILENPNRPDKW